MQYADNHRKFTIVVNRKCEPTVIMNALVHVSLGLGAQEIDAEFLVYDRADINRNANISKFPVIVFSAKNSSQLNRLITEADGAGISHNYFTTQMLGASAQEQIDCNRDTNLADLNFVCVALFGDREIVGPLTKRFSLFKS